ncbi:hypothetical protein DFS34DRAFT_672258 [Phlyctochytrium arcticum]|nr:hypothetical protein DFS34DRAFT_672258 [Phlyctochytrium arcticum]
MSKTSSTRGSHSDNLHSHSSSSSSLINKESNDLIYKLSKKIAQLTKVIYYLNTKNEDHATEVQSLAEAYEDEISEVLGDARARIKKTRDQMEDGQLKLRAHEEVIQSYLEKISAQESKIASQDEALTAATSRITSLEQQLLTSEKEKEDAATHHAKTLESLSLQLSSSQSSESADLQSSFDRRQRDLADLHTQELTDVKAKAVAEMEELRTDLTKKINGLTDEKAKLEERISHTVSTVKSRQQDEVEFQQQEIRQLKQALEDQVKESRMQIESLEKRLTAEHAQEHQDLASKQSALAEATDKLQRKSDRVLELEAEMAQLTLQYRSTKVKIDDQVAKSDALDKTIKDLTSKLALSDSHTTDLQSAIDFKDRKLADAKTAYAQLQDRILALEDEIELLKRDRDGYIEQVESLKDDVVLIRAEKGECERKYLDEVAAKETCIQEMESQRLAQEKLLSDSLSSQHATLQSQYSLQLQTQIDQSTQKYEQAMAEKAAEITALMTSARNADMAATLRIEEARKAAEEVEAGLRGTISRLESEKSDLEAQLSATQATLDERMMDINKHLLTIQHNLEKITSLEIDKADLFQKMVHIDESIRKEMADRFEKERVEISEHLDHESKIELQRLRDTLESNYTQDLQTTMTQRERQYDDQIQAIRITQQKEIQKMQRAVSNAEGTATSLEKDKALLQKHIRDLEKKHRENVETLSETHAQTLLDAQTKWDAEAQARDTQLKVASTIALAQLEKRLQAEKEDLEAAHRKQVDELRTFHTLTNIAAKKEAESMRLAELHRLETEHERTLAQQRLDLTTQASDQIEKLELEHAEVLRRDRDAHAEGIRLKEEEIERLEGVIEEAKDRESQLRITIATLTSTVSTLESTIREKDQTLHLQREESTRAVAAAHAEHLKTQAAAITRLNESHLSEVQTMIKEFEQAQAFLKRQIQNQKNALQEADQKYLNREPREMDTQRIADLEKDLGRGKDIITALMEELQYYKLEMNNRETSFNKIFNKTPMVGLMQPTLGLNKMKSPSRSLANLASSKLPPLISSPQAPS